MAGRDGTLTQQNEHITHSREREKEKKRTDDSKGVLEMCGFSAFLLFLLNFISFSLFLCRS